MEGEWQTGNWSGLKCRSWGCCPQFTRSPQTDVQTAHAGSSHTRIALSRPVPGSLGLHGPLPRGAVRAGRGPLCCSSQEGALRAGSPAGADPPGACAASQELWVARCEGRARRRHAMVSVPEDPRVRRPADELASKAVQPAGRGWGRRGECVCGKKSDPGKQPGAPLAAPCTLEGEPLPPGS